MTKLPCGLLLPLVACAPIQVDSHVRVTPISQRVERRTSDRWAYQADVTGQRRRGVVALQVTAQRWHPCEVDQITESRQERVIERTNTAVAGTVLVGLASLTGPLLLRAGWLRHRDGEPLSRDKGSGSSELTTAGDLVVYGTALSLLIPFSVRNVFAAIDSSDDLGKKVAVERITERCDLEPVRNRSLTLATAQQTVASAPTNAHGKAELEVAATALADPALRLRIDDESIALSESVRAAARDYWAEVLGGLTGLVEQAPPGRLQLAHVALKSARRAELEAAVRRAGAVPVDGRRESPHLSRFDLGTRSAAGSLANGLRFLDLIFDDRDRFVAAALSGPRRTGPLASPSDDPLPEAPVVEALRQHYGAPQMIHAAGQDHPRATWQFDDGVEMTYQPSRVSERPAKIVIVDVTVQDALEPGPAVPGGEP